MHKLGFRNIKKKKVKIPSPEELNSLLAHYQNGRLEDAEKLAIFIAKKFPKHAFSWKVLGAVFKQTGRMPEALSANQKAIVIDPQDVEAYNNLGNTLQELNRLEDAEAIFRQAIALKPGFAEAHSNLGNTLQKIGRLEEAEASYKQAIALKPDYAEAHSNLGVMQQGFSKLEEAEASYKQAIALKPDYAEAHNNLGNTLKELGRLEEAEASYKQAIALKPDYAEAHSNLGKFIYINGNIDSALESIEKASFINPKLRSNELLLRVIQARKARANNGISVDNESNSDFDIGLKSNPLIVNRAVEAELIANLYEMKSIGLDKMITPRYGAGRWSSNYLLFEDDRSIIQTVAEDLSSIMRQAVNSDIYVDDSFFNILGAGGGLIPHNHIGLVDRDPGLSLTNQKYSLVYYLSIGNQDSSEPGILKLYDPSEDILPCEGMITIFPANRNHSVVYGGEKDRVVIGVNFYSL